LSRQFSSIAHECGPANYRRATATPTVLDVLDLFDGMPVHALVLHATVVLLPLMSLVTVLVALVPRWRGTPAIATAVIDAALIGLVWVTAESGNNLQIRLSQRAGEVIAKEHGERGGMLIWFAVALFAASVLTVLLAKRGALFAGVCVVVAIAVAAGTTGWTIYTGDAGARATWEQNMQGTQPPP
jgi:uncharacterized membrane protein